MGYSAAEEREQIDSVSVRVERLTKELTLPSSKATLTLSFDSLRALLVGAGWMEKNGQATVAVTRTEGGVTASANCDSLTLLVDELKTEIFHLNAERTAFKSERNEEKMREVNRLTSWQSFQIWTGRICLALLVVGLGIKGIKHFKTI
ncbi:MAG: hypothetical protein LBB90_06895 [Tannerella sp.]|nr:hypothetical protein [Tannerella sp.]